MSPQRSRILICDDEDHLREMVGEYLIERGNDVVEARDADSMREAMGCYSIDLVILDINMPGKDGLTALRELRNTNNVPVIMLTAASEVIDRVVGLEMGADDYLGKPVDLRELEARIKAALRRRAKTPDRQKDAPRATGTVAFGACSLDIGAAKLFDGNGKEIAITAMEFDLLRVFQDNRGRVLNRNQLLEQAHDKGWEPFDRSIDLRISRIRKKVEANPTKPELIRTVRGLGYIFG